MSYTILRLDPRHEGWSTFLVATIRTPDGHEIHREIEDHGSAVAVLPYDPARRVATLARQFRPPLLHAVGRTVSLEVPAGLLDADRPEDGARREAEEEVGLALSDLEPAGCAWSMPGISTERIHLFLAAYSEASRTGVGGGLAAEGEHIEIEEFALADLASMVDDGRLDDMKTMLLVQTLRLRRPDLFAPASSHPS